MRLDFPTEIMDRALEISVKKAATGDSLDRELSSHLANACSFDLSSLPFFKLIYSMILQAQQTVWQ